MKIKIGYLYSELMNIYGDTGNIICLKKRLEWRGYEVEVVSVSLSEKIKHYDFDFFFFGGGQDQAQNIVSEDMQKTGKNEVLKSEIERGVPLLSICGGYQLLGEYYQPHLGAKLPGAGVFPVYTLASQDRMIGNIVIKVQNKNSLSGKLVGFENHSGKTYLKKNAVALGEVITGFGNNGDDKTEGCLYKNAIGCYMHGSLLPKNPVLADWFIKKILELKLKRNVDLKEINDEIEIKAHDFAVTKFG